MKHQHRNFEPSQKKLTDKEFDQAMDDAHAMHEISVLPETLDEPVIEKSPDAVIEHPDDLKRAIGYAQLEENPHDKYVIVSPKLFEKLVRGLKTEYITYGSPGVKIYKEGSKDMCDAIEAMTAEQYHEYIIKKKNAEFRSKVK